MEICDLRSISIEVTNFLDASAAYLEQHSSRGIILTFALGLYPQVEDCIDAVEVDNLFVGSIILPTKRLSTYDDRS